MKKRPSAIDKLIAVSIVLGSLYIVVHLRNIENRRKIEEIMKDPVYTTGVLTEKRNFKGTSGTIEYGTGTESFSFSTSIDAPLFARKSIGDTLGVIYEKGNPENVMLQYDKGRKIYQL